MWCASQENPAFNSWLNQRPRVHLGGPMSTPLLNFAEYAFNELTDNTHFRRLIGPIPNLIYKIEVLRHQPPVRTKTDLVCNRKGSSHQGHSLPRPAPTNQAMTGH